MSSWPSSKKETFSVKVLYVLERKEEILSACRFWESERKDPPLQEILPPKVFFISMSAPFACDVTSCIVSYPCSKIAVFKIACQYLPSIFMSLNGPA